MEFWNNDDESAEIEVSNGDRLPLARSRDYRTISDRQPTAIERRTNIQDTPNVHRRAASSGSGFSQRGFGGLGHDRDDIFGNQMTNILGPNGLNNGRKDDVRE